MPNNNPVKHLVKDVFIVAGSVIVAVLLSKSGAIENLVGVSQGHVIISAFIAGAFFTSVFTIAPAGVALIALSEHLSIYWLALIAALGATLIDHLIISFIRKDLNADLNSISQFAVKKHIIRAFHFGFLKWVALVVGIFFVATPLPDELGLFFIGVSNIRASVLPVVFYASHFLGILTLLTIASAI